MQNLHIKWRPPFRELGENQTSEEGELWRIAWAALARLVGRLESLQDLTYDSGIPFPTVLLPVLHAKSRTVCRVHIQQFKLRSLIGPMFDDGELGDFELSVEDRLLATSPCLYSIRLQPTSQQRSRSFNPQAVKQLVQGANPHLKVIEICRKPREKARPFQRRTPDQRLREWSGIPSAKFAPRAALESLQLASTYVSTIDVWHSSADLVQLRTLRLGRVDLAVLRWIEANSCHGTCVFPQLKCLELDVARSGDETASDAAWVTQTVLRCLPPLEDLTLNGRTFGDYSNDTTEAILAAVLQHHGPSLLSFSIPQTLNSPPIIKTAGDALRVMATCPRYVACRSSNCGSTSRTSCDVRSSIWLSGLILLGCESVSMIEVVRSWRASKVPNRTVHSIESFRPGPG